MNNDLISRKWLTDAIRNRRTYLSYEDAKDVIDLIDNAPAIEYTFEEAFQKTVCEQRLYCPARPQGEWIEITEYDGLIHSKCSQCQKFSEWGVETNYCPNCGAKMKGGATNDT